MEFRANELFQNVLQRFVYKNNINICMYKSIALKNTNYFARFRNGFGYNVFCLSIFLFVC